MANRLTNRERNSTFSQRVSNDNNASPPDGNHVDALLEEARTLYKDQYPPFVSARNGGRNYHGNRKVVVLANNSGCRPTANDAQKAEIICHAWDASHVFWTLDHGGNSFIVKVKGAGFRHEGGAAYRIWRGLDEGFDKKIAAFSPQESRDKKDSQVADETEQPDEESPPDEDPPLEPSDEEYEAPQNQQSPKRKQQSRAAKDKGNATIKHLATVTAETNRKLKKTRGRQRPKELPKHKPRAQARPNTNNAARPSHLDFPNETSPSIFSGDSPPARPTTKRQRDSSESPSSGQSEPLRRNPRPRIETSPSPPPSNPPPPPRTTVERQGPSSERSPSRSSRSPSPRNPQPLTRSPSIIEIHQPPTHPSLDHYQQTHTTLYISLSTNDYGPVPIYLRTCMTVESFFTCALSVWGLEGKEDGVAAVAVRFDWLKKQGLMVVRRGWVDSFEKMLERIAQAPVWSRGGGGGEAEGAGSRRRECDVRVQIVMRDVPAAT